MTKRTLALAAMLVAAVPAMAQETEEAAFTGVIEAIDTNPPGKSPYGLYFEEFGSGYFLRGEADFAAYEGQTVTVYGTTEVIEDGGIIMDVSRIEPEDAEGAQWTLGFEVAVEGEVPEGTNLSGSLPDGFNVPLADDDGDGVYTGGVTFPARFYDNAPQDGASDGPVEVLLYGNTTGTPEGYFEIKNFGATPIEDGQTFSASYSFEGATGVEEQTTPVEATSPSGGTTMGETTAPANVQYEDGRGTATAAGIDLNEDGTIDEADGEFAVQMSEAGAEATPEEGALPDTGGILLPLVGAGLLISAGGLLIRRARH